MLMDMTDYMEKALLAGVPWKVNIHVHIRVLIAAQYGPPSAHKKSKQ